MPIRRAKSTAKCTKTFRSLRFAKDAASHVRPQAQSSCRRCSDRHGAPRDAQVAWPHNCGCQLPPEKRETRKHYAAKSLTAKWLLLIGSDDRLTKDARFSAPSRTSEIIAGNRCSAELTSTWTPLIRMSRNNTVQANQLGQRCRPFSQLPFRLRVNHFDIPHVGRA